MKPLKDLSSTPFYKIYHVLIQLKTGKLSKIWTFHTDQPDLQDTDAVLFESPSRIAVSSPPEVFNDIKQGMWVRIVYLPGAYFPVRKQLMNSAFGASN